ncbi:hypothetical protein MP228_003551 [Amoeboaphelidium protococcarum]|nr:hypothetical protein MP228_003551 [Amoeboaphelidium protococcarum]
MTLEKSIRILALGDGNFSFSLALAKQLYDSGEFNQDDHQLRPAHMYLGLGVSDIHNVKIQMICTSFDSRAEVLEKYPESDGILRRLSGYKDVQVLHQINAWNLDGHFPDQKFDIIYWNHPHLGTENFHLHRFLLAHFLHSAKNALSDGQKTLSGQQDQSCLYAFNPCIIISLVSGQERRWHLVSDDAVTTTPQRLNLRLAEILPCIESDYEGYICKRNKNGQSFKNQHTIKHTRQEMKSFTYRFTRNDAFIDKQSTDLDSKLQSLSLHSDIVDRNRVTLEDIVSEQISSTVTTQQVGKVKDDYSITKEVLYNPVKYVKDRTRKRQQKKALEKTMGEVEDTPHVWKCPDCQKSYKSLRAIRMHHLSIHGQQSDKDPQDHTELFKCLSDGCSKVFKRIEDLRQHILYKHQKLSNEELAQIHSTQSDLSGDAQMTLKVPDVVVVEADKETLQQGYQYEPCPICGQAVKITGDSKDDDSKDGQSSGYKLHLEYLKPLIGMRMRCPNASTSCTSTKSFMDTRALEQHFRQCRARAKKIKSEQYSEFQL